MKKKHIILLSMTLFVCLLACFFVWHEKASLTEAGVFVATVLGFIYGAGKYQKKKHEDNHY